LSPNYTVFYNNVSPAFAGRQAFWLKEKKITSYGIFRTVVVFHQRDRQELLQLHYQGNLECSRLKSILVCLNLIIIAYRLPAAFATVCAVNIFEKK
jgi:hypothetical protein